MANIYVRSSDGSNADNGSTWALAKATVAGAASIDAAGDTVYLSSAHAESLGSFAWAYSSPGTIASPNRLLSVDDAAEPPVALSAGASMSNTGNNQMEVQGFVYCYGITWNVTTSASIALMYFATLNAPSNVEIDECKIRLVGTSTAGRISIGRDSTNVGARVSWRNTSVKFASASQGIQVAAARFVWVNNAGGGSYVGIEAGGTSPTALFKYVGEHDGSSTGRSASVLCEGLDLSNGAAGMHIVGTMRGASQFLMRNCKLPASWTGSLVSVAIEDGSVATMVNCDNGDTNYRLMQKTAAGLVSDETTLVMTGGATDGDTPISWKVVTTTSCGPGASWISPEMYVERTTVGSAVTVTVEILHDSTTDLTDNEAWLEVTTLGTSGQPLSTTTTDRATDTLTTPGDQPNSSVTWTTTGLTNPNKQYLSVSVTPQEKGFLIARVYVAKASKTLYINPEPILS